jgi:hypothetical protein
MSRFFLWSSAVIVAVIVHIVLFSIVEVQISAVKETEKPELFFLGPILSVSDLTFEGRDKEKDGFFLAISNSAIPETESALKDLQNKKPFIAKAVSSNAEKISVKSFFPLDQEARTLKKETSEFVIREEKYRRLKLEMP